MDPGTALGVASLAYEVTKDLYEYYRTWKACEKDVAELRVSLLWLHKAFKVSRDVARQPDLSLQAVGLLYAAIGACNDAANDLRDILDKIQRQGTPQTAWSRLKAHGRKACYPFRKPTVTAIKANVDACCDELHLTVGVLQLDTASRMHKVLKELDANLVNGFGTIDTALKELPTIASTVSAIRSQTSAVKADTEAIIETQRSDKERKTLAEIMDWLCLADYSRQQNDIHSRREEGTAVGFLEAPEYMAWVQGSTYTLVCPGHPGAGKTMVAATVIHELLHSEDVNNVGIAYLFCNYKRQDEQDIHHFLRALTRQLLYQRKTVPGFLMDIYNRHKPRNTDPSQRELKDALSSLATAFQKVHIVIDALDECKMDVCSELASIIQGQQLHYNIRFLVTTRPIPNVLDHLPSSSILEVRASESDVALYLGARMQDLPKFVQKDQALQEKIIVAIVSAVEGMFLLAQLHMESLRKCLRKRQVYEALVTLPKGSDRSVYARVYSDAMARIRSQDPGHAARAEEAISWIACARRPLNSLEFRHALAVDDNAQACEFGEDDLDDVDLIVSACAGLITEDEQSGTIRLVHYTAQKFFEQSWRGWMPNSEVTIALKCLKYLSLTPFMEGPSKSDTEMANRLAAYPLLAYAAKHWPDHLLAGGYHANTLQYDLMQDSALSFLRNDMLVLSATQAMEAAAFGYMNCTLAYPSDTQGTHLAGRFGLRRLMQALSKAEVPLDCYDERGRTPLSYAAESGHEAVLTLLIESGQVDVDSEDEFDRTPLLHAARSGYESTVKLLLDSEQVDVDTEDAFGRTPLSYAAENGHERIVRLLNDADQTKVDFGDSYGQTPLSYAAGGGHETIVKLLMDAGQVEVDSKDCIGRTPLSYAAAGGFETIIKLLIKSGNVDVTRVDDVNWTPLSYAAARGHGTLVKLFINSGQEFFDAYDPDGRTPLSYAAAGGHDSIVELLIESGQVEVASMDKHGRTPLWHATKYAQQSVMKLLEAAMKPKL